MNLQMGCKIHNRFDIEVIRDGEVIQRGQAENIILDRMYTRLCNLDTYFVNIVFGTGIGDLAPERTTLFSYLGYKSTVLEEVIRAFPLCKRTRKITLNPEEFVGQTITEVGISDTYPNINTHALIKDVEGNPLSITKSAIDVVVIYATVFIQLENKNEHFYWTDMPKGNNLVEYLFGSTFDSIKYRIQLSKSSVVGNNYSTSAEGLIMYKSTTKTADAANRRTIFNPVRFGIADANAEVGTISMENLFACKLPEDSFLGHTLTGVPVGIGDGLSTRFSLSHTRLTDLVVKLDAVPTSAYTTKSMVSIFRLRTGIFTVDEGAVSRVAFSPDGTRLAAVKSKRAQLFSVYGDTLVLDAEVSWADSITGMSWAPDGRFLALCSGTSSVSGKCIVYEVTATLTRVSEVSLTTGSYSGLTWSPTGKYIAVGNSYYNNVCYAIPVVSGVLADPIMLPDITGSVRSLAWSPDEQYLAVYMYNKVCAIYEHVDGVFTYLSALPDLPTTGVNFYLLWNTSYLAALHGDKCCIYDETFTLVDTINIVQLANIASMCASPDNQYLLFMGTWGSDVTRRTVRVYKREDGLFREYAGNPTFASMSERDSYAHHGDWDSTGRHIIFSGYYITSTNFSANWCDWYSASNYFTDIILDAPPAEGVVITADYFVPYIPKSSDYVLDVGFELLWGEGVIE